MVIVVRAYKNPELFDLRQLTLYSNHLLVSSVETKMVLNQRKLLKSMKIALTEQ